MSTTLGIDLASQPKKTGVCLIEWAGGRGQVLGLWRGVDDAGAILDDEVLAGLMLGTGSYDRPSKIAIDAPLGWPVDFVRALGGREAWPVCLDGNRAHLERRVTDHWIHQTSEKQPLSVSTDRIAYPAMRAAGLLAHLTHATGATIDRSGTSGPVCEAYPDPAIRALGLWTAAPRASYKGATAAVRGIRLGIMNALHDLAPWLMLDDDQRNACVEWDDCLDALVCALVARACELKLTVGPPDGVADAEQEGWIHLPVDGALARLA